jgi:hypothetical protein
MLRFEEVLRQISNNIGFNPLDRESCLAVVKEEGIRIRFIHNPDKAVQLEAVKDNGFSLAYINNPDKEVQIAAVMQNPYSIKCIHSPDKEVQMVAIERSGYNIEVIAMCPDWAKMVGHLYDYLICKEIIE